MKTKIPPLWEECPECEGYGVLKRRNQGYGKSSTRKCPKCHGKGQVPIYYTPESLTQWYRENGEPNYELPDSTPVWILFSYEEDGTFWDVRQYHIAQNLGNRTYRQIVSFGPLQPKPGIEI
jgi:hypothetical protein